MLQVDAQAYRLEPFWLYRVVGSGRPRDRYGVALPEGVLPVGEWVAFDVAGASGLFAPAFLEAAEFDVQSGRVRPAFRSEQPIQAMARLARESALPDLASKLRPLL